MVKYQGSESKEGSRGFTTSGELESRELKKLQRACIMSGANKPNGVEWFSRARNMHESQVDHDHMIQCLEQMGLTGDKRTLGNHDETY